MLSLSTDCPAPRSKRIEECTDESDRRHHDENYRDDRRAPEKRVRHISLQKVGHVFQGTQLWRARLCKGHAALREPVGDSMQVAHAHDITAPAGTRRRESG